MFDVSGGADGSAPHRQHSSAAHSLWRLASGVAELAYMAKVLMTSNLIARTAKHVAPYITTTARAPAASASLRLPSSEHMCSV